MPKFSANLGFLWPDRTLLERIEAAARAGFKAIELHWPYDFPAATIREACAAHGLSLLALNTPPGDLSKGDFGLGAVAGREAEFMRGFEQAADYVRAAGGSAIHVMTGVVPPEAKSAATEVVLANLVAAAAKAPDLTLLLEPINQRDKPGYFYSTLAETAALIDRAGAPNLRIMFDAYHVGVSEGQVEALLARHLPNVGHVQIAAVPSRAEPDEGEVDYRAFFAALDRLGYAGWVGCEYRPRAGTDEGLGWVKTLGVSL